VSSRVAETTLRVGNLKAEEQVLIMYRKRLLMPHKITVVDLPDTLTMTSAAA
jgi:hypothetical protein